jgi:hypothetical protein
MSYPEIPLGIIGIYCRNRPIANHIDLDGLPLRAKRVLRNGHLNSAPRNTFLPIFHSIILWGLGVEE